MKRKDYEKPMQRVDVPQHETMLLAGSQTKSDGTPTYNGFNEEDEEEW